MQPDGESGGGVPTFRINVITNSVDVLSGHFVLRYITTRLQKPEGHSMNFSTVRAPSQFFISLEYVYVGRRSGDNKYVCLSLWYTKNTPSRKIHASCRFHILCVCVTKKICRFL